MKLDTVEERLARVDLTKRVLLLSHCLRPSQNCPGKFDKKGLRCPGDCAEDCVIGRFSRVALGLGYKGVCVAAGGAMALRFVREYSPEGIVAVACDRELVEGVDGVKGLAEAETQVPPIVVVPLAKDGCVDTEVDEEKVLRAIALGAPSELVNSRDERGHP
ncbi:MAG: DUF116 domain-containing protein [Dehalococcoidia bacterium]|nr:DUF116 domain-containing protein [Dehalococcoidia bacterium]